MRSVEISRPPWGLIAIVEMRMPEWRDGQPLCMECQRQELDQGSRVFFHRRKYLYYCFDCGSKLAQAAEKEMAR